MAFAVTNKFAIYDKERNPSQKCLVELLKISSSPQLPLSMFLNPHKNFTSPSTLNFQIVSDLAGDGGGFCGPISYIFALIVSLLVIRVSYVLHWTGRPLKRSPSTSLRTLIVLGSGGHTAEMLSIVNALQKDKFAPRSYVAALTDNMSLQKAQVHEDSLLNSENNVENKRGGGQFMQIYRSREVGQSYVTSIGTTIVAIMHAMWIVLKLRPQVILCNGPGTCIPICACAYFLKLLGWRWCTIIYIESIARVKKLSLSGFLLYKMRLADQFFVQWPLLQQKYPRSQYAGRVM